MPKHFFFFLLSSIFFFKGNTQQDFPGLDILIGKLDQYAKAHPDDALYLHTDKTVYTNNETLWFSAYLLKSAQDQITKHVLLSIALAREDSRSVFLQAKYLMEQGWSTGSVSLPDSIPPGDYQLIATTNVVNKEGEPIALFTRPITIKSIKDQSFKAALALLDTVVTSDGIVRARVTVSYPFADEKEKKQTRLEYSIGKGGGVQSVNLKGVEHIINIPAKRLNQSDPVLLTSLKYDGQVQHLSLKLPAVKAGHIQVRFFPEGGNLVNGLNGKVGWEAKTAYKQPIALRGVLLKDDQPVDTITTNSNGIGVFDLKPDSKARYSLKLFANNYLNKDTAYVLPAVLETGVAMHLPKSVVNDTLHLTISGNKAQKVNVLIHNYRDFFASFSVQLKAATNKILVALPEIPKGLATVTVLDEEARPLAERLFFARYNEKVSAQINPEKNIYGKKEKVNVGLKLTDEKGAPVKGLVSIAVVQDNRIEADNWQDIQTYLYLENDLGRLPVVPGGGRGLSNQNHVEELLLVKGWRRYTWQNLFAGSDSVHFSSMPFISAQVKRNGKQLKKPVAVGIIRDSLIDLLTTEQTGMLPFLPGQLLVTEGRKAFLMVNEKDKENYELEISDPYEKLHQHLSEKMEIQPRGFVQAVQNSEELQLKGFEKLVTLQTVVVTTKKDNSIYGTSGANACGDYVCMYNILNCRNHYNQPGSKQPVKGQVYGSPTGGQTIYGGCRGIDFYTSMIKGVYSGRDFYGVDMDSVGVKDPQYLSTLHWEPGLLISKESEARFSFYTGDIAGRFRIVVQGISDKDAIVGEEIFTVQ